jgi:hypothetical protein
MEIDLSKDLYGENWYCKNEKVIENVAIVNDAVIKGVM